MKTKYNPMPVFRPKVIKRFWERVDQGLPDVCWPWLARRNEKQYGCFAFVPELGKNQKAIRFLASRVAYFLTTGVDPGENYVCHSCDNPWCCNPSHLFLGDHAANTADMVKKGRAAKGRKSGAQRWAKLTDEKVIEARQQFATGVPLSILAKKFGINRGGMWKVVCGKTYRYVTSETTPPSVQ